MEQIKMLRVEIGVVHNKEGANFRNDPVEVVDIVAFPLSYLD